MMFPKESVTYRENSGILKEDVHRILDANAASLLGLERR